MSGRNHQGGGGNQWEQERQRFGQPGGGPNIYQAEMYGMGYNEVQACHHQHIGRINQQVNNQGLLAPIGFSDTGAYATNYNRSQQDYYAQQREQQQQYYPNQNPNYPPGFDQQQQFERQRQQQQQGEYPQQSYYPHQNVNPNHHRHPHCHCHHGHHYGRNMGGGQQQHGDGQQQQQQQRRQQQGYQDTQYDHTYDGATYQAKDAVANAKIVAQVAKQMGVDPVVAIAAMLVESGGNSQAVGDRGTSFGLFQLHKHGELGNMSPQQAFDPVTNARTALSYFQHGHVSNPGMMVANAQRPADRAGYAAKLNARLAQAQQLLRQSGEA